MSGEGRGGGAADRVLEVVPAGLLSPDHAAIEDGAVVGLVERRALSLRDRCSILAEGRKYSGRRDGLLSGAWVLTAPEGAEVARATRRGLLARELDVHAGGAVLFMRARGFLAGWRWEVRRAGEEVCRIRGRGLFAPGFRLELPRSAAPLPLHLLLFLAWIAVEIRAGEDSAPSGG